MSPLIVHEWLERRGGAEVVVDAMLDAYPSSNVFCLWDDSGLRFSARTTVHESWLARTPLRGRKALSLPVMPMAWRSVSTPGTDHDWALISSHAFAHQARIRNVAPEDKFVYVHSPARYLWAPELDARSERFAVRLARPVLRVADRSRVDARASFAANSFFVRDRIRKAWDVDAQVIYPPVPVEDIQAVDDWSLALDEADAVVLASLPAGFLLGASRFVPYKRLDLVIRAGEAAGIPVVIAGRGPEEARLRSLAQSALVPVHIIHAPSTPLLRALYQRALALYFPAVEDFGIVPVEAMAAGGRVIVNRAGGASESVLHGISGVHVDPHDGAAVSSALSAVQEVQPKQARLRAENFSRTAFICGLGTWTRRTTSQLAPQATRPEPAPLTTPRYSEPCTDVAGRLDAWCSNARRTAIKRSSKSGRTLMAATRAHQASLAHHVMTKRFPGRTVTESWMARTPLRRSKAAAVPFMPTTWSRTECRIRTSCSSVPICSRTTSVVGCLPAAHVSSSTYTRPRATSGRPSWMSAATTLWCVLRADVEAHRRGSRG